MNQKSIKRSSVLIVDDSEINRSMLSDILEEKYNIYEAENGEQAMELLHGRREDVAVVLLDVLMPVMDGYEVLKAMGKHHYIDFIPVIMISAETAESSIEYAYELGAVDFINKPFNPNIVIRRINNTIELYNKQHSLMSMVAAQIYERQKSQDMLINILSHIVESRNGESGLHILHIKKMTEILLRALVRSHKKYQYLEQDIELIAIASSLHDIGKLTIPDGILNKPGRLTNEEFEIMKTHPMAGAQMLYQMKNYQEEKLVKYAYEICRWHHERYNGKGYPDGLRGDEIPIAAQIVSIADVYDALTSERVYKKAYSSDVAMQMIFNGECGAFHPMLLECLKESAPIIDRELSIKDSVSEHDEMERGMDIRSLMDELKEHQGMEFSIHMLDMLQQERIKSEFFSKIVEGTHFEYTSGNDELLLYNGEMEEGEKKIIAHPKQDEGIMSFCKQDSIQKLIQALNQATPEEPEVHMECFLTVHSVRRRYEIDCCCFFPPESREYYTGVVGRIRDIQVRHENLLSLEQIL